MCGGWLRSPLAIGADADVRRRIAKQILHCKALGCIIKCTVTVIDRNCVTVIASATLSQIKPRTIDVIGTGKFYRDAPQKVSVFQLVVKLQYIRRAFATAFGTI
jgi:hypothetical protein